MVPTPQIEQEAEFALAWYEPATHGLHWVAAAAEYVPGAQTTAKATPPLQKEPAGHGVELVDEQYLPDAHAVQEVAPKVG